MGWVGNDSFLFPSSDGRPVETPAEVHVPWMGKSETNTAPSIRKNPKSGYTEANAQPG